MFLCAEVCFGNAEEGQQARLTDDDWFGEARAKSLHFSHAYDVIHRGDDGEFDRVRLHDSSPIWRRSKVLGWMPSKRMVRVLHAVAHNAAEGPNDRFESKVANCYLFNLEVIHGPVRKAWR